MIRLIINRILLAIPLVFVVSILVFLMVHAIPGSAATLILDAGATPEAIAELEAEMGLDDPLVVQYVRWLSGAVRGDFGESLWQPVPVSTLMWESLPVTASIVFGGMIIGILLGLVLGIIAGLQPGTLLDRGSTVGASVGVALPPFWLAIMFSLWFGVQLKWFPTIGYTPLTENPFEWLRSITLASLALGIPSAALIARQMRSSMANVLQSSYIRAARAMGIPNWQVISSYALKNAMIPVITAIGFRLAVVIGSAFVVEFVFNLPGAGKQLAIGVIRQDIFLVQGGVMIIAIIIVLFNLFIDITYGWLNPKVRIT